MTLAAVAASRGVHSAMNIELERQGHAVQWGSNHLGWIAGAYPPVSVGAASLLPGGAAALGIAGAVCAGILLQVALERLVLRSVALGYACVLVAAVAATPVFWFEATQDFASFVALSLLSIAITGLLDFVFNRATESGFIAGLTLGLATMCDPAVVVFALAAASATALLQRSTPDRAPAIGRATAIVLFFPSLAAMAAWIFLQWRFTGSATASISRFAPMLWRFSGGVWPSLLHAVAVTGKEVALSPVLLVSGYLLARRRPRSVLAALLPVVSLVVVRWVGVPFTVAAGLILLELLALVVLPERPSRTALMAVCAASAVQLGLIWALVAHVPLVEPWLHVMT